jgi:hypothetical protein
VAAAANGPAGAPITKPAGDDSGLGGLLGANDSLEGTPANGQPGGLPAALSQLPPPPDPAAINRQAAKVETARQNLDAAQANLNAAARQTYTQGPGASPSRDVTDALSQAVFDARAELTQQTRTLNKLNYASAASGGPTVPVPALPENADVQAFPPQPSAFAKGSRALSEGSLGFIPDVAKDIDTFTNWGQASGADRTQAALDAAGMVPIPGAKFLTEGLKHGPDALGAATRHLDDVPTPHIDINMKDGWSDFQQSQMRVKIDQFNNAVGDQGFSQVPPVPRDPAVRQEFLDSLGLDRVPPGFHVDHLRDLQAGGLDAVENMGLLDGSVNTSFGSQLNKGMNQLPPGTVFGGVRLPDP